VGVKKKKKKVTKIIEPGRLRRRLPRRCFTLPSAQTILEDSSHKRLQPIFIAESMKPGIANAPCRSKDLS